jgi:hypothetical protein
MKKNMQLLQLISALYRMGNISSDDKNLLVEEIKNNINLNDGYSCIYDWSLSQDQNNPHIRKIQEIILN